MAKRISAFGLRNNNKRRWWVWTVAAYMRTHSTSRFCWSETAAIWRWVCIVHSSNEHVWTTAEAVVLLKNDISIIIRPHRSTACVDEAYCYRRSSTVCLSVCLSQSWALQKRLNQSIEMFGMLNGVDPRNHVLDGVQILHAHGQC